MSKFFEPFWQSEFSEHISVAERTQIVMQEPFMELLGACARSVTEGGKVMFCGNGGSASDSQHLATELTARYKTDRAAIASIALTTDTSALTAIGNDFGFEHLFSRQVEALGKSGDVLIGISTSGNSANVIKAMEMAQSMGITTVGFTGETGGEMVSVCDVILKVPSKTTARIQEMHITLGQMLCGALEQYLGLTAEEHTMECFQNAQKVA